jgi:hypothetical protein
VVAPSNTPKDVIAKLSSKAHRLGLELIAYTLED